MNLIVLNLVVVLSAITAGQRVAPGVPPQQYQHGAQQQYQQVPVQHMGHDQYGQPQFQQVPQQQVQYQQQQAVPQQQIYQQQQQPQQVPHGHAGVPQQQGGVPQQHGGVPQQHGGVPQQGGAPHGHGAPHAHVAPAHGQPVLNPANIQHEREHIAEHMDVPIDTSKMSDQELQFHYFKMHDSDNNNKLDGCELIKSLIHWHEQGSKESHDGKPKVEEKVFSDDELIALIDPILQMDDTSKDGYIDYPEFIKAQKKAAQQTQNRPTK